MLAALYGGVRLATRRATRTTQMPLGPFILIGALTALLLFGLCKFVKWGVCLART
jgi:prepilin signal peptidase PulO-like enzyme (type II secretory pathway)